MKKRGILITIFLIFGIALFSITEFVLKPRQKEKAERYELEQQDAKTHDFKRVIKYKSKYMGDASNLINLTSNLPLSDIQRTAEINSERLEYIINYKAAAEDIGMDKIKSSLIYNASASFALIENLKIITFNFSDGSYSINRDDVEKWCNMELSDLQDNNKWKENIQSKMHDEVYIDKSFNSLFQMSGARHLTFLLVKKLLIFV